MHDSVAADLDPSIPVVVRRVQPLQEGPPPQLVRSFLMMLALGSAAAGLLLLLTHLDRLLVMPLVLAFLAIAATAAGSLRLPPTWMLRALALQFIAIVLIMAWAAQRLGWGLLGPGVVMIPLLVCALTAVAGWRMGGVLAALAAGLVLWVAAMLPAMSQAAPGLSIQLLLGAHLLAIAVAYAAGAVMGRVVNLAVRAAVQREQRFRGLLSLAADVYWEIDDQYRLVAAGQHDEEVHALQVHTGLGMQPWDLPRFACDAETLDLLMADLETRAPFRDRPFVWRNRDGSSRSYLASGEPRFDARGAFKGYWGVARDVTAIQAARAELQATESRYQEMFARIPTPLVLHRHGRVIDANPAALSLFAFPTLSSMLGTDLLAAYEGTESREHARRRAEQLHAMPVGSSLPVANFQLRVQGKLLAVQVAGVRVQVQGGPALLSIFVDMTDRLATEDAVRRSEAMLAHLVATSPDLITLTDLHTGQYAMVNQAFEQLMGWSVDEAVGRTALDLGVWGSDSAREQFVAQLRSQGAVADLSVSFVNKAGQEVPMRVSAARFAMDKREYIVINARDVSARERERMERDAIFNNASIGIAVTRERRFVLANPEMERMYGWGPGELVGQPGSAIWPTEADYEEIGRVAGPLLSHGEPVEFERTCCRKDGSTFLALVRGRVINPDRPAEGGTAWLCEDVTERRQFEQTLARARDDAEAANRAKSAFLANTSHELRTPLNGMIGLAHLARAKDLSADKRERYLDQIADSARSLAGIISDILDLSKIEAGKLLIESTAFNLVDQLRSLEQSYQILATARGLALKLEIAPQLQGRFSGDPLRLRQILSNFLTNAIKFTDSGEVGLCALEPTEGRVRIEVHDSGPGISPEVQQRLFKPFTQADQSTTRRFGGTGLGLSICREMAQLMGGDVGLLSTPGHGSSFWVELPLPRAAQAGPETAPAAAVDLTGMRVLMVEDNPVNMMIAVAMLESWGVQVSQAHDGSEAVAAVQGAARNGLAFDAVLMDVQMPVMSGHEATRALRQTEAGRHLPIVALTAAALVTERDEAIDAGMDDFLTKPIDAERLRQALQRYRGSAASQEPV